MSASNYQDLALHVGHRIVCVVYAKGSIHENVALECEKCNEVLLDFSKYDEEESEDEGPSLDTGGQKQ